VLRVEETVQAVDQETIVRNSKGEIMFHRPPRKVVYASFVLVCIIELTCSSYSTLPAEVLSDGRYTQIFDPEIHGLKLLRRFPEQEILPTQVSLETASLPISIGAPSYARTFQVTGFAPVPRPLTNNNSAITRSLLSDSSNIDNPK
jgi:hypothetical protein